MALRFEYLFEIRGLLDGAAASSPLYYCTGDAAITAGGQT